MSASDNFDGRSFVLSGPMKITDFAHTAVCGDLAYIALAGRYFVSHYVVSQPRRIVAAGGELRAGVRDDVETLAQLDAGVTFDVFDIAGWIVWGQVGGTGNGIGGFVGYVALTQLEEAA